MTPTSENTAEMEKWAKILRAAVPQGVENLSGAWDVRMAPGFAKWSGRGVDEACFLRCTRDQEIWRGCAAARDGLGELGKVTGLVSASDGALVERSEMIAIEVWTDCELSALHALWRGWIDSGNHAVRAVVERACERLIETVQPDNATNRPWAVGVFAWIEVSGMNAEAGLYAQTLLHNYQASSARDDALCAAILLDSAAGLEVICGQSG